MALKVYVTYMQDWSNGEAEPLSTHVTEQGAKKRLIDYLTSHMRELIRWSDLSDLDDWLAETLDSFGASWNGYDHTVTDLAEADIDKLWNTLYEYNDEIADTYGSAWYNYSTHELEG